MKILMKRMVTLAVTLVHTSCGVELYRLDDDSGSPSTDTASVPASIEGGKDFELGSCTGSYGCLKGFISHGLPITISPSFKGSDAHDVDGKGISLKDVAFKDAQDFGDRFDTAFIKPLMPSANYADYEIKISPTVTRNNFANGFELFAEGLTANDDVLTMAGEGNFTLGDIPAYDNVTMRAVKTLRIEIANKVDALMSPKIICLEISATKSKIIVDAASPTQLGGLSKFDYYYTEGDEYCTDGINTPSSAKELDPTPPDLGGL